MRTIWKYRIDLLKDLSDDTVGIEMPIGARILYVACQTPNVLSFWAEISDGDRIIVKRRFQVFGTGQEIPKKIENFSFDNVLYIGTALDGEFVWHLYEWI